MKSLVPEPGTKLSIEQILARMNNAYENISKLSVIVEHHAHLTKHYQSILDQYKADECALRDLHTEAVQEMKRAVKPYRCWLLQRPGSKVFHIVIGNGYLEDYHQKTFIDRDGDEVLYTECRLAELACDEKVRIFYADANAHRICRYCARGRPHPISYYSREYPEADL